MARKPLTIRLDEDLRERLDQLAEQQERSLAWIGEKALRIGLRALEAGQQNEGAIMQQEKVDIEFWSEVYALAILRAADEGEPLIGHEFAHTVARSAVSETLNEAKNDSGQVNHKRHS